MPRWTLPYIWMYGKLPKRTMGCAIPAPADGKKKGRTAGNADLLPFYPATTSPDSSPVTALRTRAEQRNIDDVAEASEKEVDRLTLPLVAAWAARMELVELLADWSLYMSKTLPAMARKCMEPEGAMILRIAPLGTAVLQPLKTDS